MQRKGHLQLQKAARQPSRPSIESLPRWEDSEEQSEGRSRTSPKFRGLGCMPSIQKSSIVPHHYVCWILWNWCQNTATQLVRCRKRSSCIFVGVCWSCFHVVVYCAPQEANRFSRIVHFQTQICSNCSSLSHRSSHPPCLDDLTIDSSPRPGPGVLDITADSPESRSARKGQG